MNIVDLEFEDFSGTVEVKHNGHTVATVTTTSVRLELETVPGQNNFELIYSGTESAKLKSITMFDLGKDKLKYFGTYTDAQGQSYMSQDLYPNGRWLLVYEYPVFTWLHKTLDFGWLIEPDKSNT